jgi:cation diffusion facilitator CzcD-associated flavoprotein CzcO
VLAIGKFGNPRRLNVPGENKSKVSNYLNNPGEFRGKKIAVIGGGNVAAEVVLAFFEHNEVTLLVWENKFFPNKESAVGGEPLADAGAVVFDRLFRYAIKGYFWPFNLLPSEAYHPDFA